LKLPVKTAPLRCRNVAGVGSSTWMLLTTFWKHGSLKEVG
jgi:hypothetical protein